MHTLRSSTAGQVPDERQHGLHAAHEGESNQLLRLMSLEDFAVLRPHLRSVRLIFRQELITPGEPILDVYFVREGVGSVLALDPDDGEVEVGTVGNEGLVGLPLLLGGTESPNRCMVQVEGAAWRLPAEAFTTFIEERPAARAVFLRYANYYLDFVSQSVACNRLHTVEERCARWLLHTHDRVAGDRFELTQEFLAMMLGVRRPGVSVAMGSLQASGIVSYTRGRITILDRAAAEATSCGCYGITRDSARRLLKRELM